MKEKKKEKELNCGSLPTADIVGAVGKMWDARRRELDGTVGNDY